MPHSTSIFSVNNCVNVIGKQDSVHEPTETTMLRTPFVVQDDNNNNDTSLQEQQETTSTKVLHEIPSLVRDF